MKHRIASVAAWALVAGCAGQVLADPAPPSPPPPAAVASPAAPAPDPAKLALAQQIYELSGGAEAIKSSMQSMTDTITRSMSALAPADNATLMRAIQHDMLDEVVKLTPTLLDIGARAYAANLSEDELKAYVAWLKSDAGRSIVAKTPAIRGEIVAQDMPLILGLLPRLKQDVVERVCADVHCSADQRQTLETALAHMGTRQGS